MLALPTELREIIYDFALFGNLGDTNDVDGSALVALLWRYPVLKHENDKRSFDGMTVVFDSNTGLTDIDDLVLPLSKEIEALRSISRIAIRYSYLDSAESRKRTLDSLAKYPNLQYLEIRCRRTHVSPLPSTSPSSEDVTLRWFSTRVTCSLFWPDHADAPNIFSLRHVRRVEIRWDPALEAASRHDGSSRRSLSTREELEEDKARRSGITIRIRIHGLHWWFRESCH